MLKKDIPWSNLLCEICFEQADLVCICDSFPTLICHLCKFQHYKRDGKHWIRPLFGYWFQFDDARKYQNALINFNHAANLTGQLFARLVQFENESTKQLERMVEQINIVKNLVRSSVQEAMGDINQYASQLQAASITENSNEYTEWVQNLVNNNQNIIQFPEQFGNILEKIVRVSNIRLNLPNIPKFASEQLPNYPIIYNFAPRKQLIIYDIETRQQSNKLIYLPQSARRYSSWCSIDKSLIYYSGGLIQGLIQQQSSNECFLFDCNNGGYRALSLILESRYGHSTVLIDNTVYLLGGTSKGYFQSKAHSSCEKHNLNSNQRSFIAQMNVGRAFFTATVHERLIYVGGGQSSELIEQYNPVQNCFNTLPYILPLSNAYTILAAATDKIYVFQKEKLLKFSPGGVLTHECNIPSLDWYSQCPTIYYRGSIYLFTYKKTELFSLNLSNHRIFQIDWSN